MPTPDDYHKNGGSKWNGHNSQYLEDQPKEKDETTQDNDSDMDEMATESTSLLPNQNPDQDRRDKSLHSNEEIDKVSLSAGTQETDRVEAIADTQLTSEDENPGPPSFTETTRANRRPAGRNTTPQSGISLVTQTTEEPLDAETTRANRRPAGRNTTPQSGISLATQTTEEPLVAETTRANRRPAGRDTTPQNGISLATQTTEEDRSAEPLVTETTEANRRPAGRETTPQSGISLATQMTEEDRSAERLVTETTEANRRPAGRETTPPSGISLATQTTEETLDSETTRENVEERTCPTIAASGQNGISADRPLTCVQIPDGNGTSENSPLTGAGRRPCTVPPRCERYKWKIVSFICVVIVIAILIAILIKVFERSPLHHALFHLETSGYTDSDEATNLHWKRDEIQNEGNIKLVNKTYIFIPQDDIYQINGAVQLYIKPSTPSFIISLMLKQKNNGKEYVLRKKSTNSLDISEHTTIQLSFRYRFKANDIIFLKMNYVKFISPDKASSHLIITSLKHK